MATIQVTEMLGRSRASLDASTRAALEQGRTVRSRNRDGEYAIVLTDNPCFRKRFTHVDEVADAKADWTIVVPDFTLKNVAKAEADSKPDLRFYAPVIDRSGAKVGTIAVNASPYGTTNTDQGTKRTTTVFFSGLAAEDLFREADCDSTGRPLVFRATADADADGRVEAEVVATGESRIFDLGPDYLVFKIL